MTETLETASVVGRSASVKEIAGALAKAQGEMKPAKMDSTNPHFKSKYAPLSSVMETLREPFAKHGLSIVQTVEDQDDQGLTVVSMLLHESGEWISSRVRVPVGHGNAQQVGSALTYGRRYGVSALCGVVAEEDDDGNAAAAAPPNREERPPRQEGGKRHPEKAPRTFPKGLLPFGKSKGAKLVDMETNALERAMIWARDNKPDTYGQFLEEVAEELERRRNLADDGGEDGGSKPGSSGELPLGAPPPEPGGPAKAPEAEEAGDDDLPF